MDLRYYLFHFLNSDMVHEAVVRGCKEQQRQIEVSSY